MKLIISGLARYTARARRHSQKAVGEGHTINLHAIKDNEVATSMTILIYNEGQDSAFRQILQKLEYKVPEMGLIRIEKEEKARKALCEAKLAKKNEILNKRRQSQKQFAQLGSYASQAQRDIDNARQSFIVEREKNDDDLPDFNELEGPPDESEDEEIEAEVED
ncbi:unnamed protein product [Oikopleura dioica]|uniref:Uncharacterized protein n=2 Tax=Oikopleura dioica TaxID=34765 RepID=E4XI47_OIKDI|nr:unnamed protein product [Oikopleura dioica]